MRVEGKREIRSMGGQRTQKGETQAEDNCQGLHNL